MQVGAELHRPYLVLIIRMRPEIFPEPVLPSATERENRAAFVSIGIIYIDQEIDRPIAHFRRAQRIEIPEVVPRVISPAKKGLFCQVGLTGRTVKADVLELPLDGQPCNPLVRNAGL